MVKIYIAGTEELKNEMLFQKLYQRVPRQRQEKIERIRWEKDKRLSLGAFVLLQEGLRERGIETDRLQIACQETGKPFLKDYPDIFFNMSHSEDMVMCAISDKEVGCDAEKIKRADLKVAKRFFHEKEYEQIISQRTEEERRDLFYRLWTLKESFMKVTGLGMKLPLNSFCIHIQKSEISVEQTVKAQEKYFFQEYDLQDGYKYACCQMADEFEGTIKKIKFN